MLLSACSAYVPEKVTADGLLAVRRGMTYEEVEALIGPPLCVSSFEDERMSEVDRKFARALVADCGPLQISTISVPANLRGAAKLNLSYAEPSESHTDPNIYLNFKAGHVASVYIKKGDMGICCREDLATGPFYGVGSREVLHDLIGR
jgi:hypothetical protein